MTTVCLKKSVMLYTKAMGLISREADEMIKRYYSLSTTKSNSLTKSNKYCQARQYFETSLSIPFRNIFLFSTLALSLCEYLNEANH